MIDKQCDRNCGQENHNKRKTENNSSPAPNLFP